MQMHHPKSLANLISDVGSPSVVGTLFLLGLPLLHPQVSWIEALLAATFVTLIPTLAIVVMRARGVVGDRHITNRKQRAPLLVTAAFSIIAGVALLFWIQADAVLFVEVAGMFLGLIACSAITVFWKVSIHSAVATYVGLVVTSGLGTFGPIGAVLFSSTIGWARVRSQQHTPSQVLAGQMVGCAVYCARALLL